MKNLILFTYVVFIFAGCKKSSDKPSTPTGNYIKIDNDTRQLGDVPNPDVSYIQAQYPDGPLVSLAITNKATNIDDSKNEYLTMSISLFEGDALTNEYKIENVSNHSPSSASINIWLSGNDINAGMHGKAGKLYVTRDGNNKITSFKFENVEMKGNYEATVSSNIVVQ